MDDKYLENIDNLAGNVEDLLSYLTEAEERKNDDTNDVDVASFETVQTEFSTFNKLLLDIKTEQVKSNDIMSAYLQKNEDIDSDGDVETEETPQDNIDDNIQNTNSNFDVELETFNNNLVQIINKFEEIKTNFETLNIDYDFNVSEESIEELKKRLDSDLAIDININEDALNAITEIEEKLSVFGGINFDTNSFVSDIELVRTNLEFVSNMEFDNLNFNAISDGNIDELIEKINKLKGLEDINLDLNLDNDITEIETILNKIKDIDFTNLELNIQNINEDINKIVSELGEVSTVELSVKINDNISEQLSDMETKINEFVSELPPISIDSEINVNTETEQIIEDIEQELDNFDLTLKPNIDLSEQIEQLNNDGLELDLDSNIEIDTKNIEKIVSGLPTTNTENINDSDKQDIIIENLVASNTILKDLSTNIEKMLSTTEDVKVVTGESGVEVSGEVNSVGSIGPKEEETPVSEESKLLKELVQGMALLIQTNEGLRLEMVKKGFNTSIGI